MGYSIQLKNAVLKKVLQGNKPHYEIAAKFGVGRSTIGKWLREYRQNGNINLSSKEKRPKDWTAEERMAALMKSGSMDTEDRAAWCRKKGIFVHNLNQWKKDAISAIILGSGKKQSEQEKSLKNRHQVYQEARSEHPERWSGKTRNWSPSAEVVLKKFKKIKRASNDMKKAA